MIELAKPYWVARDGLPGLDFNREIVEPGRYDAFPDGAVGIYVDDDFWSVAALPLERYRDVPIQEIVAEVWPEYAAQASYAPDRGTHEQAIHFLRIQLETSMERAKDAEEELAKVRDENARYRAGRTDILPRRRTRLEHDASYLIDEYEHLLTAMAHEAVPMQDTPGICSLCGLYGSDRVHKRHWIEKKAAGYRPGVPFRGEFGTERSLELDL